MRNCTDERKQVPSRRPTRASIRLWPYATLHVARDRYVALASFASHAKQQALSLNEEKKNATYVAARKHYGVLTLLELQSHFGNKALKFQIVCPRNGTAVLKGVTPLYPFKYCTEKPRADFNSK